MHLNTAVTVSYSPTGTSNRVAAAIATGLATSKINPVILTPAAATRNKPRLLTADIAVIAVPVYSGRVAATAVERMQDLRVDEMPAILVVVYGNRAFEDALIELCDLAVAAGFRPVAAAAFIGEHSYSQPAVPLAVGRPDEADLRQAHDLGQAVSHRLLNLQSVKEIELLEVPGNRPYKDRPQMPAIAPEWLADRCTACGLCAEACPTAAIGEGGEAAEVARCTLCCACVKVCPEQARVLTGPWIDRVSARLAEACALRRDPEIFFEI